MTNVPVVSFEPVKYAACALPTSHPDYADFVIRVIFRPWHGQWEVFHAGPRGGHGGQYLSADGTWSREGHHFDLDTARGLAVDAALTVAVHGRTVADVIAADKQAVVR
ncbi:hypothetical protein [Streptomyces ortus]|uniref:Uncharacterized protein n=1 Tax=Streptomyces ortus TaxID=2867268 RepID=A0ABT3UVX1_9ACTN|nr:hypothetical protein [Streptomyces ortus]MCX4231715.1 hypothetical protein [Streptomyces ortus]